MLKENLRLSAAPRHLLAQADVQCLPFANGLFNWVLCTRVLSHLATPRKALAEFARVARPRAEIFISDVHPAHPYDRVSIATAEGDVAIETFKHSIDSIKADLGTSRHLRILSIREYRTADLLWLPPRPRFEKIFRDPGIPIFYVLNLLVVDQ
jgi:SAM-dependent methyltransferase